MSDHQPPVDPPPRSNPKETAAIGDEVIILVSQCCASSQKGGEHGIVCRSCYAPAYWDHQVAPFEKLYSTKNPDVHLGRGPNWDKRRSYTDADQDLHFWG